MNKNWQTILGVVLSLAWLGYLASTSIHQHDSLVSYLVNGFIPIGLCWGAWRMVKKRLSDTQPKEDYLHFALVVCMIVAYIIAANYAPIFWGVIAILLILDGVRLAYTRKRVTVEGQKLGRLGMVVLSSGVVLGIIILSMWLANERTEKTSSNGSLACHFGTPGGDEYEVVQTVGDYISKNYDGFADRKVAEKTHKGKTYFWVPGCVPHLEFYEIVDPNDIAKIESLARKSLDIAKIEKVDLAFYEKENWNTDFYFRGHEQLIRGITVTKQGQDDVASTFKISLRNGLNGIFTYGFMTLSLLVPLMMALGPAIIIFCSKKATSKVKRKWFFYCLSSVSIVPLLIFYFLKVVIIPGNWSAGLILLGTLAVPSFIFMSGWVVLYLFNKKNRNYSR
jgi:hypothetical protein